MKRRVLLGSTIILILIAVTASVLFIWIPLQVRSEFENFWFGVMKNLNSPETKANVTSWFDRDYSFTEIYDWVHENLEFVPENETLEKRYTDPSKIREYGKGRCQEFSILYVAACLSHGYQSRIVVSVEIGNPWFLNGKHAWAEVMLEGWVHVDPSDKVWNEPYRYETWDWGKDIGSNVQIYAFEEGKCEDVTSNYKKKE